MQIRKKVNREASDVSLQYSNWFSQLCHLMQPTNLFVVAGRATSKSEDILAQRSMDIAQDMQGCFTAISSDTYMNATKNIVPSIINGWQRKGWVDGIHYVTDIRPPKHFKLPYKPILNWKHTATTLHGTHFKIISQDRPSIGAGDSYQHHIGDEAKYLNEKKLNKVNPAVRGEFTRYGRSPFYGGLTFLTDMPNVNHGEYDWILRMADNMDKDKIRWLLRLAIEVNEIRKEYVNALHFAKENPGDTSGIRYLRNTEKKLKRWEERLRKFRMDSTFFYVVSSLVNVDVLTTGYFKKLLQTMDFREFMVSVLSIEPKLETGQMFYPNLSSRNFFSDGYNYGNRDLFGIMDDYTESCVDLTYLDADRPIEGGLDTGNMCSLVLGQEQGKYLRVLKEMFTLPPRFLPEMGAMFREYFKLHRRKELQLWADRSANNMMAVGEDHASKLAKAIEYDEKGVATGWTVSIMSRNQGTIYQQEEYELMLELMSGRHRNLPMLLIDKHTCPNLKSSVERAEKIIKVDRHGNKTIHKDKSTEKLPVEQLPKKSTNFSDALKYFCCRPHYLEALKGHTVSFSGDPTSY